MAKEFLFNPKTGICVPFNASLLSDCPFLVPMDKSDFGKKTKKAEPKEAPKEEKVETEAPKTEPVAQESRVVTADNVELSDVSAVSDENIVEFGKSIGVDCSDLLDLAGDNETEREMARKAVRRQIEKAVKGFIKARAKKLAQ